MNTKSKTISTYDSLGVSTPTTMSIIVIDTIAITTAKSLKYRKEY